MIYVQNNSKHWHITYKIYDEKGRLTGLSDIVTPHIKSQWRVIRGFLLSSTPKEMREVTFMRSGKWYPSMIAANGKFIFADQKRVTCG